MDARKHGGKEPPTAVGSASPRRNFTLTVDERIRALTIGAPAWAVRKRKIEDEIERLVGELVELHDRLRAEERTAGATRAALAAAADAFDLTALNARIATHNRYYPVEANLAMSPDGYVVYGRPWRPEPSCTADRLLELAEAFLAERDAVVDPT